MAYFLGIDVSTTATKALLIDSTGQVTMVASVTYTFETPRPLWRLYSVRACETHLEGK
jgi:xylulokinase